MYVIYVCIYIVCMFIYYFPSGQFQFYNTVIKPQTEKHHSAAHINLVWATWKFKLLLAVCTRACLGIKWTTVGLFYTDSIAGININLLLTTNSIAYPSGIIQPPSDLTCSDTRSSCRLEARHSAPCAAALPQPPTRMLTKLLSYFKLYMNRFVVERKAHQRHVHMPASLLWFSHCLLDHREGLKPLCVQRAAAN